MTSTTRRPYQDLDVTLCRRTLEVSTATCAFAPSLRAKAFRLASINRELAQPAVLRHKCQQQLGQLGSTRRPRDEANDGTNFSSRFSVLLATPGRLRWNRAVLSPSAAWPGAVLCPRGRLIPACLQSGRKQAQRRNRCGCIQAVADRGALPRRSTPGGARVFDDPHTLKRRASPDSKSDNEFRPSGKLRARPPSTLCSALNITLGGRGRPLP